MKNNSYDEWLVAMDSHMPRWWIDFATQRDLQDVTNAMVWGFRAPGDTEAKLRSLIGPRLFEVVRAWVSLPHCGVCGKEITLAILAEPSVSLKDLGETEVGKENAKS